MSSGVDHHEFTESLAAYALGALPDEECVRMREHVASCRECRAELEWLRAAVDSLPASVAQVDPPPELRDRVMNVVQAEAELLRAVGESADRPERARPARRGWRGGLSALSPSVALVAACCAAVVAGGLYLSITGGGPNTRTIHAHVSGVARRAHAHVTLQVTGTRAELMVSRLPVPPAGHVDELWVQRGVAAPVPAGTFVVRSGSVLVAHPVRAGDHVLVTVEHGVGSSVPTTTPFIVAKA